MSAAISAVQIWPYIFESLPVYPRISFDSGLWSKYGPIYLNHCRSHNYRNKGWENKKNQRN